MARTRRRAKAPSFKPARKKGFSKSENLFGSKPKEDEYQFATLQVDDTFDPRSDVEKQVTRTLNDEKLAKAVMRLKAQHPNGSLPELVTLHYLLRWNVPHWYQVALFGGHVRGGLIPDFILSSGTALEVQGQYWHEGFEAEEADRTKQYRMLGQNVNGIRIEKVVEIWEQKLYDNPDRVVQMAIQGIGLGE